MADPKYPLCVCVCVCVCVSNMWPLGRRKAGHVLFNDALNTFYFTVISLGRILYIGFFNVRNVLLYIYIYRKIYGGGGGLPPLDPPLITSERFCATVICYVFSERIIPKLKPECSELLKETGAHNFERFSLKVNSFRII